MGSTQHLKNKYGGGYHLDVKYVLDSPGQSQGGDPLDNINNYVRKAFPSAVLEEHFGHRVTYKIPLSDIKSLAKSFASLEQGMFFTTIDIYKTNLQSWQRSSRYFIL